MLVWLLTSSRIATRRPILVDRDNVETLLGKLGVQNGDVLRTINGFDLSSPDSALEAYSKLRESDAFSIAMVRRGQPKTMEYSVK